MIQMIINGQTLDLFKNEVFALSKAISKLGEFDLRHGDVSIKYKLPITNKNASILGYVTNLNNYNKSVFNRLEGELRQDESILSSGYFQVLKINPRKSIEIRFYGGNSDWFDLINDRDINKTYENVLGNPNLKSYDLSFLNHSFTDENIVSSWDKENGYFYFPTDNGQNFGKDNNIFDKTDFQCGIFQHTIFKEIFDSIGIKLEGSLFKDPLFFNTLLNQPLDINELFDKQNNLKRFRPPLQNLTGLGPSSLTPVIFNENDFDPQWSGTVFTAEYNIDSAGFIIELITTKNINLDRINFEIKLNNVVIESSFMTVNNLQYNNNNDTTTFNALTREFNDNGGDFNSLSIGDTLEFLFQGNFPESGGTTVQIVDSNGQGARSRFEYELDGVITPFTFNEIIPQINQADFVKDVMFRNGVISQFNAKSRILTLNKLQDIENNKGVAVDYSDKIDISKPVSYDFTKILNGFKKTSRINYKQDNNDIQMRTFKAVNKVNLGDAVIDIKNDNLSGEGVIYESPFAGTLTGQSFLENLGNQKLIENFYIPVCRYRIPNSGEFESQDLQPRLFVKAGKIDVSIISNFNNISFDGLKTQVGYAYFAKESRNFDLDSFQDTLSFDNISEKTTDYIGTTLLQKNYELYVSILNNPIQLDINLNLKPLDVEKLDFMKPIWLIDSYYYINNLSQYKGDGTTTKIQLVKI